MDQGPMSRRLEQLNDVMMLLLIRYLYWGAVKVVQQGDIGKAIKEVLHTVCTSLSARQEESCLSLRRGRDKAGEE